MSKQWDVEWMTMEITADTEAEAIKEAVRLMLEEPEYWIRICIEVEAEPT